MKVRLPLRSVGTEVAVGLIAVVAFLLMGFVVLRGFIAGVFVDDRVLPRPGALAMLARFMPGDARIQAKLARSEYDAPVRDLKSAERHALRACSLSPWDFNNQLLLASIEDAAGDQQAAGAALQAAGRLAPNDSDVHWRLANFFVREGRIQEAAAEFKSACSSSDDLLPSALDTMWQASGQASGEVIAATPDDAMSRLKLAAYLLSKSQVPEAVSIFENVPRADRIKAPMTRPFVDTLIAKGQLDLAKRLWVELQGLDLKDLPLIEDGGFESRTSTLGEFDWKLSSSKYAEIGIDSSTARSGSKSLRISFKGLDTTVLNQDVSLLAVLAPGKTYTLEWYVKAEGLNTPEGPRIVVTDAAHRAVIASSDPIRPGSYEWTAQKLDFALPSADTGGVGVLIMVKRKPKFSYDDPTRGTIWLDDFAITPK